MITITIRVAMEAVELAIKIVAALVTIVIAIGVIGGGIYGIIYLANWIFEPIVHKPAQSLPADATMLAEIARNRGWLIWIIASMGGLLVGLYLTFKGKQTQEKQWRTQVDQWKTQENSSLHERYTKATEMLGHEQVHVRVAGCRSLSNLATYNDSMRSLCVRSLLSYLNSPYLSEKEDEDLKANYGNNLENFFTSGKKLREDIQTAADSLSDIYQDAHSRKQEIDDEVISLPHYFLLNQKKKPIRLIGGKFTEQNLQDGVLSNADLRESDLSNTKLTKIDLTAVELQNANLSSANLQEANLKYAILKNVNFGSANMAKADLETADITNANLKYVEKLTKEQVLSAVWGTDENDKGKSPNLPDELMKDKNVQKWCEMPHYKWENGKRVWYDRSKI